MPINYREKDLELNPEAQLRKEPKRASGNVIQPWRLHLSRSVLLATKYNGEVYLPYNNIAKSQEPEIFTFEEASSLAPAMIAMFGD